MSSKIVLPKSLFQSSFWEEDKFTKGQAFIDIYALTSNNNLTIDINFLINRWQWEKETVLEFFELKDVKKYISFKDMGILFEIKRKNGATVNRKKDLTDAEKLAEKVVDTFNKEFNKRYKKLQAPDIRNLDYWMETYTEEEILESVKKSKAHHFWQDKIKPQIYFRKKNTNGDPVDYIGEFLNYKSVKQANPFQRILDNK